MSYLPIVLQLAGRHCLVIGGGAVAERRIAVLLEAGAAVTVVSPDFSETIERWSEEKSVHLLARPFRPGDVAGFELACAAADNPAVNAAVYAEGRQSGVWVNVADDPAHCDFIFPSVLRRGELTVAVSTGGASPALARTVREELESRFTAEYEPLARLAAEVRDELKRRGVTIPFDIWRNALCGEVRQFLKRGELARARAALLRDLAPSAD